MEKMKFELSEKDSELAQKFMKEHVEVCPLKGKYQGAIGVSFTFSFTQTSIGMMSSVACFCNASTFLSEDL